MIGPAKRGSNAIGDAEITVAIPATLLKFVNVCASLKVELLPTPGTPPIQLIMVTPCKTNCAEMMRIAETTLV